MRLTAVTVQSIPPGEDNGELVLHEPKSEHDELVGSWEVTSITALREGRVLVHWSWCAGYTAVERLQKMTEGMNALINELRRSGIAVDPDEIMSVWIWDTAHAWAKAVRDWASR